MHVLEKVISKRLKKDKDKFVYKVILNFESPDIIRVCFPLIAELLEIGSNNFMDWVLFLITFSGFNSINITLRKEFSEYAYRFIMVLN